jgi:hypothetical protein
VLFRQPARGRPQSGERQAQERGFCPESGWCVRSRPRAHVARIGTAFFDIDTVALPAYSRLYRKIASEGHA